MNKRYQDLRIIFMGTPEFAVASLSALLHSGAKVIAVITAPDKPAGRGMKLTQSAVKKYALEQGLTVLQPEKLKDPAFIASLKALNADVQVVVAFRMLPEIIWNMPPLGTINVHGSLLPQYRGAAPINWAVINGEKETGVTTFKLKHEIDTGNILLQKSLPVHPDDTAGTVHDRMKETGAELLVDTLQRLAGGTLREIPQRIIEEEVIKQAPKLFTENCRIDWNKSMDEIYNLIRGLSPYPTAFCLLDHKILKIFQADKIAERPSIAPGAYQTDHKTWLRFAAKDGYISVKEIQLEGKKRMQTEDFLRGYKFM